jgi:hypothetical protein
MIELVGKLLEFVAETLWTGIGGRRRLRLLVHRAYFSGDVRECYFINATNLSHDREIEITHVWFDVTPKVFAMPPDRPLPKRLKTDETWETWVEADRLPRDLGDRVYTLARARLSTGRVVKSRKNEDVPSEGTVPGGPIRKL